MPQRFLTAEDVRRHGPGEIVVDEGTLVTPQALEEATARGVVVRTQSGTWTEPTPDRGPDAALAERTLPHLPEPDGGSASATGVVVTAVGRNRSGVLAEITAAITGIGGNVHDISQKMIEGYFHLILTVEIPAGTSFDQLKVALECLGGTDDYAVRVMHEKVFRFMHRV